MSKLFKARASMMGALFTSPRNKTEKISETCKSYLHSWYLEDKFGISNNITSKYTSKGLLMEEDAIKLYNSVYNKNLVKNDLFYEDEFCQGTPDLEDDDEDMVIDTKCSFSLNSFPFFDTTIKNKDYIAQLQTYMRLTGKSKARLVYCLLDTPEEIIIREAKSIMYKENLPESFLDILIEEVSEAHTFSHIAKKDRIKVFDLDRDEEMINLIPLKVNECRDYLKSIQNENKS